MPILSIQSGDTQASTNPTVTIPFNDTFTPTEYGPGWCKLVSDNGQGLLLDTLLRGYFEDFQTGDVIQDPYYFGGLTPDNTANGYTYIRGNVYQRDTQVPNSNAPLVNYVFCSGIYLAEVLQVIDDETMIVKDPNGLIYNTGGNVTLVGISTNSYPLRNGKIITSAIATCNLFLPGQAPLQIASNQVIDISPNNYEEIEPFMVQGTADYTTMIFNE